MPDPRPRRRRRDGGGGGDHAPRDLADRFKPYVEGAFGSFFGEVEEAILAEVVDASVLPEVLAAKVMEQLEKARDIEIEVPVLGKISGKNVGLTARWIAVPALVIFQAGLTSFVERVPSRKAEIMQALRVIDPTGGLIGTALTAGKSVDESFEGFMEGLRGGMTRELRRLAAIDDDTARAAAMKPSLDKWIEWKARIRAKLGAVAPVGAATPATTTTTTTAPAAPAATTTATTTPAAAGVRNDLMFSEYIMAMLADPARKADGERLRDIYRDHLDHEVARLLNENVLYEKGGLKAERVAAAMLLNNHTDYVRPHPFNPSVSVTQLDEVLILMLDAAWVKANPPAAPPAAPATETVNEVIKVIKDKLPPGVSLDDAKQKGVDWRDDEAAKLAQAQQPQPERSSWGALKRALRIP